VASVTTQLGIFEIPDPDGRAEGPVTLSIRPEKILFVPVEEGLVRGKVKTGVFLGNQWLFQIDSPLGEMLVVHQNSGHPEAQAGEEVGLRWDVGQVRVLKGTQA
jgi:putative spermidine/putrescine transport system ATP-binding protein